MLSALSTYVQRALSLIEHWLLTALSLQAYVLLLTAVIDRSYAWSRSLARHRAIILLAALAVFTYRDLWPLATFNTAPADGHLGWIGWARVVLTLYAGAIVPLVLPGVYVPADPKVRISLEILYSIGSPANMTIHYAASSSPERGTAFFAPVHLFVWLRGPTHPLGHKTRPLALRRAPAPR